MLGYILDLLIEIIWHKTRTRDKIIIFVGSIFAYIVIISLMRYYANQT